jgi:hypothetical protein
MASRLPDPNAQPRRRRVARVGSWLERALHLVASGQTVGPAIWTTILAVAASLLSLWGQLAWPWRVLLFLTAAFLIISLATAFRRAISLRRRAAAGQAVPPPNPDAFVMFLQQGTGTIYANETHMTIENRGAEEPAAPRPSTPEVRQALSRDLQDLAAALTRLLNEHEEMQEQISIESFNENRRRTIEAKRGSGESSAGRDNEPFDMLHRAQENSRQLMSRYHTDFERHVARLYEDARAIGYKDERLEALYRHPHILQLREMARAFGGDQ